MTVAVKYCGGCNPRYDRTLIVRRLREDFPQAKITGPGAECPDVAAVVCGCHCRCADHRDLAGRYGKAVLASLEDYEALAGLMAEGCGDVRKNT